MARVRGAMARLCVAAAILGSALVYIYPALMAIFVLDGSPSDQQQHAHQVHTRFLAHYASAGITAADVPLLRLTLNNHHTPFSVIVG